MLSNISIKTDCDPTLFVKRIEQIARPDPSYSEINLEINFMNQGVDVLNLIPVYQYGYDKLVGQIISWYDDKDRVHIEIRAHRWKDDYIDNEIYTFHAVTGRCPKPFLRRNAEHVTQPNSIILAFHLGRSL